MKRTLLIATLFLFVLSAQAQVGSTGVYINGQQLRADYQQTLEQYYRTKIQKGRYWYDANCGLWGLEGKPAAGWIAPGLQIGGPLKSTASNGKTGIYINGRQIDATERYQWHQLLGNTIPGRYTLDGYGNLSVEGGTYLVNITQLARNTGGNGSGTSFHRNWYTGTGSGSSSEGFYIMGKDWSYSSF